MPLRFTEAHTVARHQTLKLYKDEQDQGVRMWQVQEWPGFDTFGKSEFQSNVGVAHLLPGGGTYNVTLKPSPFMELEPHAIQSMPVATLDSSFLEVAITSPSIGPHILTADIQLNMYYWQQNQAPFVYGDTWNLELPSSSVVDALSEWFISKLATSDYSARMVGALAIKIKKALTPYKVRLVFRCGTSTPKGQWMLASFRCESVLTRGKLALPAALTAEEEARVVCAGTEDSFVLLDLPSEA